MKKTRRQTFMIKSDLQLKVLWYMLLGMILTFAMSGFAIWGLIKYLVSMLAMVDPAMQHAALSIVNESIFKVIVTFFLILTFMTLISIYFSNRIAGPIFRIEKDLKTMINEKRLFKLIIRKNDLLHNLVGELNELFEKVIFKKDNQ